MDTWRDRTLACISDTKGQYANFLSERLQETVRLGRLWSVECIRLCATGRTAEPDATPTYPTKKYLLSSILKAILVS